MSSDTLSPELGKIGDYSKYIFSIPDSGYSQLFNEPKSQLGQAETPGNNSDRKLVNPDTSNYLQAKSSLAMPEFRKPLDGRQERVIELLERIKTQNEMILNLLKPKELVYEQKILSIDDTLEKE
ncbi:hypothetical protein HDV06_002647 [Boothiomyces sp. JEL0866]|nr:hypothetical protein HDV06_002647 [Boothiomyces sp. JEL0866]